jgi:Cu+-exporting ATPase
MVEYKLSVDGMHCNGCRGRVEKMLKESQNVNDANVVLESKVATVHGNENFKVEDAIKTLTDAGYKVAKLDA